MTFYLTVDEIVLTALIALFVVGIMLMPPLADRLAGVRRGGQESSGASRSGDGPEA